MITRPLALGTVFLALVGAPLSAHGQGTAILDEPFDGVTAPSAAWLYGGSSTPSVNTNLLQSPASALRLTGLSGNAFGWAQYTLAQPSTAGLDISFWQSQWGGTAPVGGADGIAFFLKRGDDAGTGIGAVGAALGYSTGAGSAPGLSGGLIGVGLDAWGGYGDPNAIMPGCPSRTSSFRSTQLAVRGPQTGTRLQGYCLLPISGTASTYSTLVTGPALLQTPSPNNQPWTSNSVAWATRGAGAQQWRIVVDPSTVADPKVTVTRISAGATISHVVDAPPELLQAATFKFGFASATGSWMNNNEVWGLSIRSVAPLSPIEITRLTLPGGTVGTSYACEAISTSNGVAPVTFTVVGGSLPLGLTLNTATGEICGTPTRGGNYGVTVRATDSRGGTPSTDDQAYTLAIADISPPCTPVDLRASARDRSADLGWAEDPDPSCPGITHYDVEADTGETCTVPYPTATCAINGLAPGVPVRFRVRARNSAGSSAWSAYSGAITPPVTTVPAASQEATEATALAVQSVAVRRGATLSTRVSVAGPGRIVQAGFTSTRRVRLACRDAVTVDPAGEYLLSCQFTSAIRVRLCAGPLRIRLRTTFTTSAGLVSSGTRTVVAPRRICRAAAVTG